MNRMVDCGKMDMAMAVYTQLERLGLRPNVYTYGIVIKVLCRKSSLEEAVDVFRKLLNSSMLVSEIGMFDEAVDQFKSFKELGIYLDEIAYHVAIDALCKLGKVEGAVRFLDEMKCNKMVQDVVNCTTLINGLMGVFLLEEYRMH
ncbi:hypothetical protein ACH5RR_016519 [Cinchona calisaya]|uniref:Pentatricopeptide repeat-containing protein n=1 Tax=Cinchona calisaya TaxID=153742 RepID=A0ABD2ZW40_9GENT